MADGISLIFEGIASTRLELARINRSADRATMWTVRQAGRRVRQIAAKAAPVYGGPARDRWVRGTNVGPMKPGDLRRAIKSSKRLRKPAPGTYELSVVPRGYPGIYSQQQENRQPYMAPANAQISSEATAIAEGAWTRATRWRR